MNEYINNSFIDHKHNRFDAIDIPVSEEIKNELTNNRGGKNHGKRGRKTGVFR